MKERDQYQPGSFVHSIIQSHSTTTGVHNMSWSFGDPSGMGDQWKASEHVGRLVAFVEPERKEMETKFGSQEATVCRFIVVLDGDDAGSVFDDPIVFGNISRDAFSNGDEKVVLGVVGVGDPKPGQSPPFILSAATDEQKSTAAAWFTQHASLNAAGRIQIKALEGKF